MDEVFENEIWDSEPREDENNEEYCCPSCGGIIIDDQCNRCFLEVQYVAFYINKQPHHAIKTT